MCVLFACSSQCRPVGGLTGDSLGVELPTPNKLESYLQSCVLHTWIAVAVCSVN